MGPPWERLLRDLALELGTCCLAVGMDEASHILLATNFHTRFHFCCGSVSLVPHSQGNKKNQHQKGEKPNSFLFQHKKGLLRYSCACCRRQQTFKASQGRKKRKIKALGKGLLVGPMDHACLLQPNGVRTPWGGGCSGDRSEHKWGHKLPTMPSAPFKGRNRQSQCSEHMDPGQPRLVCLNTERKAGKEQVG